MRSSCHKEETEGFGKDTRHRISILSFLSNTVGKVVMSMLALRLSIENVSGSTMMPGTLNGNFRRICEFNVESSSVVHGANVNGVEGKGFRHEETHWSITADAFKWLRKERSGVIHEGADDICRDSTSVNTCSVSCQGSTEEWLNCM